MTSPRSRSLDDALELIDRGLGDLAERNLVSATEITDLLLDVRTALTDVEPPAEMSTTS